MSGYPLKILLVDDEEDILHMAAYVLRKMGGHEVLMLQEGDKVVETARENKPDVILLDYWVGDLTGGQILEDLKKEKSTSVIPVIFLTGKNEGAEVERLIASGAKGVILKPFDPATFSSQVEHFFTDFRLG